MKLSLKSFSLSRRKFIQNIGFGTLAISALDYSFLSALPVLPQDKKLGIALVGLGSYSQGQLAPALQETKLCRLSGIVTGTPQKEKIWSQKYNIPEKNIYNYENFDQVADNEDIDIIYVVLPIAMHKEFTIRAAKAGKHVICEKPMAVTVQDCEEMIKACNEADKMLSIGYRLHFEPYNQEMMRLGQEEVFGPVQKIDSANGYIMGENTDPNIWRLNKELAGGGPLMDMGVYVVQGARYVMGKEPIAVTARMEVTRPDLFKEVEETMYWNMEFEGGVIANCMTSYNKPGNHLRAEAREGWFELSKAFRYGGMEGSTSKGKMNFSEVNQQALQMDDFAYCILNNKPTRVPGEEGLRDMKVIEAIYKAAEKGSREKVV